MQDLSPERDEFDKDEFNKGCTSVKVFIWLWRS